jgi:hypothetical protein
MRDVGQRLTSFVSVWESQACGLTPLGFALSITEAMMAQLAPPLSLPAKRVFFRLNAIGRMERSTRYSYRSRCGRRRGTGRAPRHDHTRPCRDLVEALRDVLANDVESTAAAPVGP